MTNSDRNRYRPLILLAIALILRVAVPGGANYSYIFLAIYALTGIHAAIHAILISWLFTMATLGQQASIAVVGRFGMIFVAAISVFIHYILENRRLKLRAPIVLVTALLIYIFVHSVFFSSYPGVSLLKAMMWGVTYITLFIAWSCLRIDEYVRLEKELFIGLGLIVFLSLPFLASSVGYLGDVGFKGIFGQPQAFGVMLSVTGAWAISKMVSSKRFDWFSSLLFLLCMIMIVKSGCRTGGFALMLGMAISLLIKLIFNHTTIHRFQINLVLKRISLLVLIASPIVIFAAANLQQYVQKGRESEDFIDLYLDSRGSLLDPMLINIKRYPFSGIGFGVASDPESMIVYTDPYLNLPINAIIEKGALPIATLEELGIPGFTIFLAMFIAFSAAASSNSFIHLSVLMTCFCTNLAEYTFYSIGGMGMLLAILITWSASKPLPAAGPRPPPRRVPEPGTPVEA